MFIVYSLYKSNTLLYKSNTMDPRHVRSTKGVWYSVKPGQVGIEMHSPDRVRSKMIGQRDMANFTDLDRIIISQDNQWLAAYNHEGSQVCLVDPELQGITVIDIGDWKLNSVFFDTENVLVIIRSHTSINISMIHKYDPKARRPSETSIKGGFIESCRIVYVPHTRHMLVLTREGGCIGYRVYDIDTGYCKGDAQIVVSNKEITEVFMLNPSTLFVKLAGDGYQYMMDVRNNILMGINLEYARDQMVEVVHESVKPNLDWIRLHINGKWSRSDSQYHESFGWPLYAPLASDPEWAESIAAVARNLELPEDERSETVYNLWYPN